MNLKELDYMLAIAKYQNITKAAESLYITQPALTRFLQNIEKEFKQKFFKKLGNKFIPTYAGERYIEKAREILALKKELYQEMSDISEQNQGVLRVSFPVMRGSYMLPCTLPIFGKQYPNVQLNILEADSGSLESMILNGETDLAFFNLPIESPYITYEVISQEEILLVTEKNHHFIHLCEQKPTSKYPYLDFKYLKNEPLILQTTNQRTRQIVDKLFAEHSLKPQIKLTTRNIRASVELATTGYASCFVCETHLKHIGLQDKLAYFSLGTANTKVEFVAAYRSGIYIPSYALDYITIVKDFT